MLWLRFSQVSPFAAFGSNIWRSNVIARRMSIGPLSRKAKLPLFFGIAAISFQGLTSRPVSCEGSRPSSPTPSPPVVTFTSPAQGEKSSDNPPPPKSSLSLYELSFGTVAGICAGVFVKKGAKLLAFTLGGIFVLLQYLSSRSWVRVNWTKVEAEFEEAFYKKDSQGRKIVPTISSAWSWLVHFLTADFQPRASFCAGLLLGLRVG